MMRNMNIAMSGYGRMGRLVEEVARSRGHEIAGVIELDTPENGAKTILEKADAVIEFAHADGVLENARRYAAADCPAVVGTTGWERLREEVRSVVETARGAYLWGNNFSVGAHVMFALSGAMARLFETLENYDIYLTETHHRKKLDYPSGTALTIAERVLENAPRKKRLLTEPVNRAIEPEEFVIASLRAGTVPGIHTLGMDSEADTITLSHTARSRKGFATGAVLAAEWLHTRKGFFSVDEFMAEFLPST